MAAVAGSGMGAKVAEKLGEPVPTAQVELLLIKRSMPVRETEVL